MDLHALVNTNTALVERCNRALEDLLTSRGGPRHDVERVLADDPQCVLGHCLRVGLIVRADDDASRLKAIESVGAIEAMCPDAEDPAHRHAFAGRAWLDGDHVLAAERYGTIVSDFPHDVLALVVAHSLDFRLGNRRMLKDRVAQVLPKWESSMPNYASILAMYAFGLEESGHYKRAEKIARRALAIDPWHPGAIHVIAHVMEMQGRSREGLEFLAATESAWMSAPGLSVHLAWHRALFHLDADDPKSALAVYDSQIVKTHAADASQLADASALLWRLQLHHTRLRERWQPLADHWEKQSLANMRLFNVVHALMALAAAGRTAAARRIFSLLPATQRKHALAPEPENALLVPLCKALYAFACGNYSGCIEWLKRVRHIAHRCGGSLAQCDLIHLTLTEAALRAHKESLARTLVAERTASKPKSRLNRRLRQRLA